MLSSGLLSEIVQHPLAGPRRPLKRSLSSDDRQKGATDHTLSVSRSLDQQYLDEAHLFFLQNNIGVTKEDVDENQNRDSKKNQSAKKETRKMSPISSLAQTIADRLSSQTGGRIKSVKPSDVVKMDKQIFG